jgi:hypothetical protein
VVEEAQATIPIAVTVRGSEVEFRYVADDLDTDSLGLALADTIASMHGGALTRQAHEGEVSLVLALGGESDPLEQPRDHLQVVD